MYRSAHTTPTSTATASVSSPDFTLTMFFPHVSVQLLICYTSKKGNGSAADRGSTGGTIHDRNTYESTIIYAKEDPRNHTPFISCPCRWDENLKSFETRVDPFSLFSLIQQVLNIFPVSCNHSMLREETARQRTPSTQPIPSTHQSLPLTRRSRIPHPTATLISVQFRIDENTRENGQAKLVSNRHLSCSAAVSGT